MEPGMWGAFLSALKEYPGIVALLAIIWWLFKSLKDKDQIIKDFLLISQGDIERMTKLNTLIEILVSRKEEVK